ncbi:MAG: metallophosphoesterase family protein [Gemmatimonadetes bacterium]|nr:metallophosphoesterase family protein [Gemmatimonadota bacterium]
MRLLLFSDVHGNGPAFRAFLSRWKADAPDLTVCLGDVCGYYFDEVEVAHALMDMPGLLVLRGNHDDLFLRGWAEEPGVADAYRSRYGPALDEFLDKGADDVVGWLQGLAPSLLRKDLSLACFHGSPSDPLEGYVYPDSDLEALAATGAGVVGMGHTHYPMVRPTEGCLFINPGSVGQPRHGGLPSYALVDLARGACEHHHVDFDQRGYARAISRRVPQVPYLSEVLMRAFTHE